MTRARAQDSRQGCQVMVLVGSPGDLPLTQPLPPIFAQYGLTYRIEVASAHRQPQKLRKLVAGAERQGARVFIAMAGMAAHLPGVVASLTPLPVIGVPVAAGPLRGVDALLSIAQMPAGVPVAAVAIDGAKNAVHLAARILALSDPRVAAAVAEHRRAQARGAR